MFSAIDWTYIELFCWAALAALVNIAIAQFYFLFRRRRFVSSSTILLGYSVLFIGAYIYYSVNYIYPYFFSAYYIALLSLDASNRLIQTWADVMGIPNIFGESPRAKIWIFFWVGIVALPLLEFRFIFSRWLYPYLDHLAETVKNLKRIQAESDNWTDEVWRKNDTDDHIVEYGESVEDLCGVWIEHWELNHERDFSWPAFLAVFFLGEKNFVQTRKNFINDNMEPIRRWSMITGKEIPKW